MACHSKTFFLSYEGRVNCVRFNLDESNLILSGSIDGKVKIWDLRSRSFEHLQEIDDCKDSVTHVDLNDHELLISCLDKKVRLYDVRYGKMKCDYVGKSVTCSSLSQDNQCILTSALGNSLMLFDKVSGELLNEYKGHRNLVYNVQNCMSNNCSFLMSGSEDGFVYIWDVLDVNVKQKLQHSNDKTVHSLSFHPAENRLLSAQEKFVYLWSDSIILD